MVIFIFGSTGDLVRRKIIPAFISLKMESLEVVALGRKEFTDEMYEQFVCNDDCFRDFEVKPKYHKIEFGEEIVCEDCDRYLKTGDVNYFYSALPPKQIGSLIRYVGGIKRGGLRVRLLIEKPFGQNLEDALALKNLAEKEGLIDDIYISDHYLFKEGIRELTPRDFKELRIVSLESVGLEKRAAYYDEVGAFKDMIQSHFFNIVFKLLYDPRGEFRDVDLVAYERGQYGNGINEGYAAELGRQSQTETFVRVQFKTENHSYEFVSGKSFDKKIGFLEYDKQRIVFDATKHDYSNLFLDFFANRRSSFGSIDGSILAWQICDTIDKSKPKLRFYDSGTRSELVINEAKYLNEK
jgi:glucose-6-phosphate 1-dehydrogenase